MATEYMIRQFEHVTPTWWELIRVHADGIPEVLAESGELGLMRRLLHVMVKRLPEDESSGYQAGVRYPVQAAGPCTAAGSAIPQPPTKEELERRYDAAPTCPNCGGKHGFVMGTGDCGCDVDPN